MGVKKAQRRNQMSLEQTKQAMSAKMVTVSWDDHVRTAYQIMQEKKIRHLPVIDDGGQYIGILSDRDIRRAMKPKSTGFSESWEEKVEFFKKHKVKDFMSWPIQSVNENTLLLDVARKMLEEKFSALLVCDTHGHPRGIITTDDLLSVLIGLLEAPFDASMKYKDTRLNQWPAHWGAGFNTGGH